MGEVNRLKKISNEPEFLATKEYVNGTFKKGEVNRLKIFCKRAGISCEKRVSQWDVYNGLSQPIEKDFKR